MAANDPSNGQDLQRARLFKQLRAYWRSIDFQGMIGSFEIAFPEVEHNFVERALLPLFGFCEPEHSTFGIMQRALSAKIFLAADFDEPVHELHPFVKPIHDLTIAESDPRVRCVLSHAKRLFFCPC